LAAASRKATYLARAFGHPTAASDRYADLARLSQRLRQLAEAAIQAPGAPTPAAAGTLGQCRFQLLGPAAVGSQPGAGVGLLEKHFALARSQQLSDEQLLQFNMLLERV